ncbi:MAG: thioesterase family protein [Actinomycetota bacterium]|nr:thioesterase family protein [Actinomycetota bacterium]
MAEAVFIAQGDRYLATELSRGPWNPDAQHGGAPAALLMRAFERLEGEPELSIARVTYELLRPVPLGELELRTEVIRPGRRVQLLEGSLFAPDGTEVVRARALKVRRASVERVWSADSQPPPPEQGVDSDFNQHGRKMFGGDAMELRFVSGAFSEVGPATAWFRLRTELVAGERPSSLQRLAAAADFPNGIGSILPWEEFVFINPDLTIYVEREPVGEWICLRAEMRVREHGVGFAEAILYDTQGRVGRSLQALLVTRRTI